MTLRMANNQALVFSIANFSVSDIFSPHHFVIYYIFLRLEENFHQRSMLRQSIWNLNREKLVTV